MKRLAEGLWTHSAPFSVLGAEMGTRMTVLSVGDDLVLCSPTPMDDALASEIEGLGRVRWIVAPCLFHHLYVGAAKERWPDAEVLTAPGLTEKVKSVPSDRVLDGPLPEWSGTLDARLIGGMPKLNEIALLHRPSETLVLTDFLFHLTEGGWWTRTFLSMAGAFGGPRQSKLMRSMVKDREATRESRDALLDWDYDALVVSHGQILERGGKDALKQASAWLD